MLKDFYKILILGAGPGGISVAAKLCQSLDPKAICLVDPAENHDFQPLWTIAGAGLMNKEETRKPQASVIPADVDWASAKSLKSILRRPAKPCLVFQFSRKP
jgi:NADH dehydrogenase FAD-containing subunit